MKILLVEDDALLASGLLVALRRANYTVDHVSDGPAAIQAVALTRFDLMVLDLGLPTLDGTAVLKAVRASDNPIPVLVLSARDSTRDRVQGPTAVARGTWLPRTRPVESTPKRARS